MRKSRDKRPARPKRAHFDYPIAEESDIIAFVNDRERVEKHAFYPFLHHEISFRRFRKDRKNKKKYRIEVKSRPIRVASHRDTYIFHHYSQMLSEKYEAFLTETPINDCVLAYRAGKGSNIDFAQEAFSKIKNMGECVVIAADLRNFFETIDHVHLKASWVKLLGQSKLPTDHFKVFQAITRYAFVEVSQLKRALGLKQTDRLPRPIFSSTNKMRNVLRKKDAFGRNLIQRNQNCFGIPQGSPISALLSNISMVNFDIELAQFGNTVGGLYRRYSDDVLLAVPTEFYSQAIDTLEQAISGVPGDLSENREKRVVSVFNVHGQLVPGQIEVGGVVVHSRMLQYLGFLYDGERVTIRSQTLARYWRKTIQGVRAAKRRAAKNGSFPKLRKRKIYSRFSHLGKMNLHTYKRVAQRKISFEGIKQQFSRSWRKLQKELESPIKKDPNRD